MTRREKLRHAIWYIFKHHLRHPFDRLWSWAEQFGLESKVKRFHALSRWSADVAAYHRQHNQPKKARAWAHRHDIYHAKFHALARRLYRRRHRKDPDEHGTGTVTFDGRPCAKWIAYHLGEARRLGYWSGVLLSGYRTPEYSEHLCELICGNPSCPGLCAGRSSNHCCPTTFTCQEFEGAGDVTDPAGFQHYCRAHGNPPLHGNGEMLPADPNHFSRSGH